MRTTIDASGRLVIPKEIRRQAGIEPGVPLDVRCRDGRIEIEPVPFPVKFVRDRHFLVAVPEEEVEPLTTEAVAETLRQIRNERGT